MKGFKKDRKWFSFSVMLIMTLLLTACGGTAVPSAAADYAGKDHELVKMELSRAGFKNIEEAVIEDLTSEESREDGHVESVSIDDSTDFAAGAKFSASAKIVITYHVLPKIAFPLTEEEIDTLTAQELAEKLKEAGYTNVESEILDDLDPDETESAFENEIKINGRPVFHEGEEIPFDAAITVIGHYPFEKFDVRLLVDYESNILFGKYVIDVLVDGEKVAEMKNGEEAAFDLRLKEGEHELTFAKTGDNSVNGKSSLSIEGNCEFIYRLKSHTNYIDVNEVNSKEPEPTPEVTETPEPTPAEMMESIDESVGESTPKESTESN